MDDKKRSVNELMIAEVYIERLECLLLSQFEGLERLVICNRSLRHWESLLITTN